MPIARTTTAGITSGVVLLAAVAGFGIGVPELTGDGSAAASASTPELPDTLGTYTAVSALTDADAGVQTPEDQEAFAGFLESAGEQDESAATALSEQYGDASVRIYVDADGMANVANTGGYGQFSATVVPGDGEGLVISGGPYETDNYELRTIDGNRCSIAWRTATAGAEPTALDYQVECRTAVDGLVYDIYAVSIAPEDVSALLTELIETT